MRSAPRGRHAPLLPAAPGVLLPLPAALVRSVLPPPPPGHARPDTSRSRLFSGIDTLSLNTLIEVSVVAHKS